MSRGTLAWNSHDEEAECQRGGYPRPRTKRATHALRPSLRHPDEKSIDRAASAVILWLLWARTSGAPVHTEEVMVQIHLRSQIVLELASLSNS